MKRYLAIFGILFIGVIAGLIVRGIPIVLQVNAGGGIQADRNGDVNGDARLDMSDAVYLLLHIFRDGPQPVAFAQGIPGELEGPLADIADSVARQSLKNSHERFVDNGDGTVTDRHTRLMWPKGMNYGAENALRANRVDDHAEWMTGRDIVGYTDWRLPTVHELFSFGHSIERETPFPYGILVPRSDAQYWTSTFKNNDPGSPLAVTFPQGSWTIINNGNWGYILPVRDIE